MPVKPSRIILGIDPGIADTGYGVIRADGSRIEAISYGSIKTPKGETPSNRLVMLETALEQHIQEHQPELLVIEQLFFAKNVTTAFTVAQARGVVLLVAGRHQIPIHELTPLQVKQTVTGFGKADKKQVQQMVKLLLKLETIPQPDDAADALAIAIAGSNVIL
ncbi:MAG: crossover junction endodeoxyribonuclease RuvC [Candidatus Buchananbacteria bacterium]|nr:crossover junction endodeoxyribonuclease RuvC [Candidatus Buchananbacteria bacterium]